MKKMLISMLAMAAMVSCNSESDVIDEVNSDVKTPIELQSSIYGVETKALTNTSVSFDEGDNIALTLYKGTTAPTSITPGGLPSNSSVSFTVRSNNSLAETANEKTMFWERNTKHYFYAYYPIVASDVNYTSTSATTTDVEKLTIKVPTSGNTTDLLMAKIETGLVFSGTKIETDNNLLFTHKLSKIKFIIKKDASYKGAGELKAISAVLNKDEATCNIIDQTITLATDKDITIANDNPGVTATLDGVACSWEPIVLPGSNIKKISLTIDDETNPIELKISKNATLVSGNITTITITLKGAGVTDLTNGITPWGNNTDNNGEGEII